MTKLTQRYSSRGHEGQIADTRLCDTITRINRHPKQAQVSTLTVGTANDNEDYAVTILGIEVEIDSGASSSTSSIAEALADAINADPILYSRLASTADAAVVTLTARQGGVPFTITDVDSRITAATATTAAAADPVPMGRLVVQDPDHPELARLAEADSMTAQVVIFNPNVENNTVYTVTVTIDGTSYTGRHTSGGSANTKQTISEALKDALDDVLPDSVKATRVGDGADGRLHLTSQLEGLAFTWGTEGPLDLQAATTPPSSNIDRIAAGVAVHQYSQEMASDGSMAYAPESNMSVLRRGACLVRPEDEPSPGAPVYVRVAESGEKGAFRGSPAAGCLRLHGASWEGAAGDGLYTLRIDLD